MQKHVYLSVLLGLIFNTFFFAQNEVVVEEEIVNQDGITEITIERTIVDEDGNETKVVIKKMGDDADEVLRDEMVREEIERNFNSDLAELNEEHEVIILRDVNHPRRMAIKGLRGKSCAKKPTPKVRMGVELHQHDEGVRIGHVVGNSAAGEAGLQADDVITHLDDEAIADHYQLTDILMTKEIGDMLNVTYLRNGEVNTAQLQLKPNIAHPDNAVKEYCRHLEKPCLGVRYNSWNEGITLTHIYEASGAAASGLQADDKLKTINGQAYNFGGPFDKMIKSQKPGTTVEIEFERQGEKMTTKAEIGVWDECGVCNLLSETPESPEVPVIEDVEYELTSSDLRLESFDMFPVPAQDRLTVSFIADAAPVEVTIYDVNGKVVALDKLNDFSGSFTKTYDVQDVSKGMAIITIEQNGMSTSRQALIQ